MANPSVAACVAAIRQAGREGQIHVLTHDRGPEIRAFLKAGQVDFTIDQNLTYQSQQALSVLFRAVVEHKPPEQDSFYPDSLILNAETI
jgi:LacI family transcriptional regulator